jgi:hypothetical protein
VRQGAASCRRPGCRRQNADARADRKQPAPRTGSYSEETDMNQSNEVGQKCTARCVAAARSAEQHGRKGLAESLFAFLMLISIAGLWLLVVPPRPGFSQGVQVLEVDVSVVAKGHRVSKLIGSNVSNDKNERIGTIDDIIVGRDRLLFAVLQVGGFLGIGARLVAIPYQSLVIDDAGKKIELPGATREALQKLTEFKHRT